MMLRFAWFVKRPGIPNCGDRQDQQPWKSGAFCFLERPSPGQAAPVSYRDGEAEDKVPSVNPTNGPVSCSGTFSPLGTIV
jgi:hypothetical protein